MTFITADENAKQLIAGLQDGDEFRSKHLYEWLHSFNKFYENELATQYFTVHDVRAYSDTFSMGKVNMGERLIRQEGGNLYRLSYDSAGRINSTEVVLTNEEITNNANKPTG